MKKLAITLGSIAAAAIPVATAVSCSVFSDDESTKSQGFVSDRRLTVDAFNKYSTTILSLKNEVRKNAVLLPGIVKDIHDQDRIQYRFNITFIDGVLKFIIGIIHSGQETASIQKAKWIPNNGWSSDFEATIRGASSVTSYVNKLFQALMKAQPGGTASDILALIDKDTSLV